MMSDLKPVGLQLYSLREALSADFEGAVRAVADIGYVGVEPFGGMTSELNDAASLFRELELEVLGSHIPYPDDANQEAVLEIAEAFGLDRVCIAFMPPSQFETLDDIKRTCQQLNRAGEFARENGLELGYHNHWWEYKELDGAATLDLMLSELDDQVFLQIDTYWVQVGGLDAADVLRQVGSRAPLIHLKDGSLDKDDDMTALGQGKMDVPGIVTAAQSADWHIVELDRCATDMLQAVRESCDYLVQNGLARRKQ
ncbi:MAG: sugar phosphate isomerase/epimerase [Chloroflexi bacterium]|nr:sugar phosphate isomerase/epimerase [Chloroflexota bacterium]